MPVHSYGHKPSPRFYVMDDEPRRNLGYGLEIETDYNRRRAEHDHSGYVRALDAISEGDRFFYLKTDGSLSNDGIEVVTHVGSLKFWLNTDIIKDICRTAIRHGYRSHQAGSSCGLHIHASVGLFGSNRTSQQLTVTKLIILLDRFWPQVIRISRRTENQLSCWSSRYNMQTHNYSEVASKNGHSRVISIREHTYELRMFKGTLKRKSIYAALEFYDVMIDFCRQNSLQTILDISFNDLRTIIESNTSYLPEYLNERLESRDPIPIEGRVPLHERVSGQYIRVLEDTEQQTA